MLTRILVRQVIRSCVLRAPKLPSANVYVCNALSGDAGTDSARYIPNVFVKRLYSHQQTQKPVIVDYDYVKNATSNNNILIIDVRDPEEIKELGKIPNSINIPVASVTEVLGKSDNGEFEKTYQKPKPTENTEIIFYCKIGRRSGIALENATKLGYKNVKNYLGSFTDWATKIQ